MPTKALKPATSIIDPETHTVDYAHLEPLEHELDAGDDRLAAVILSARCEDGIRFGLSRVLLPHRKPLYENAFMDMLIRIGEAVGFLGPSVAEAVSRIATVRNLFAHSLHPGGIDDPPRSDHVDALVRICKTDARWELFQDRFNKHGDRARDLRAAGLAVVTMLDLATYRAWPLLPGRCVDYSGGRWPSDEFYGALGDLVLETAEHANSFRGDHEGDIGDVFDAVAVLWSLGGRPWIPKPPEPDYE